MKGKSKMPDLLFSYKMVFISEIIINLFNTGQISIYVCVFNPERTTTESVYVYIDFCTMVINDVFNKMEIDGT